MGTYLFNKHVIAHRFCLTCGIHPFAEDKAPGEGPTTYINVRCLEGIDPDTLNVVDFDGRSL